MKKYFIPVLALMLAAGSAFTTAPASENSLTKKWFRFDGAPGQEMTASLYTVVGSPLCPSTTAAYRCEIFIEAQASNPNLPDLSFKPSTERKKPNP